MDNDDNRALAAIGSLMVDLFARQTALVTLLRSQHAFSEEAYQQALRQARADLNQLQPLATLRSQASAQRLEEIEKILRAK